MSIMSNGATYAKDLEVGKIYSFNMGEVQKDVFGGIWFYNTSTINVYGCPSGGIMLLHPDDSSLFYYLRDVDK